MKQADETVIELSIPNKFNSRRIFYRCEEISPSVGDAFLWPRLVDSQTKPPHLLRITMHESCWPALWKLSRTANGLTRTLTSVRVVKAIPESCSNFTVKKFIARGPFDNGSFTTHYSLLEFPSLQPSAILSPLTGENARNIALLGNIGEPSLIFVSHPLA